MKEKLTKVTFTNLGKVLFPRLKITKADFIEYYIRIAPKMLGFLANRPLVLNRFPDGVEHTGFYEKNAPQGIPSWVKTTTIYSETAKRDIDYVLCNNLDTLIWLANIAAIEIHIPLSKVGSRKNPDIIFFDIDPEPPASIKEAAIVTLFVKEKLETHGFKSYVKTSGKKGFHVLIPIVPEHSFQKTRSFVHRIGIELAKEHQLVVSELKETKIRGKVFVDYLQNSQGRTFVSPYSLRAIPEATVSTPLEWSEVKKGIKPTEFNISNVVKRNKDPWKKIFENKQRLTV